MQMRQHLNICPKQLTWNKCLAAQKHGVVQTDLVFCFFFGFLSFQISQDPQLAIKDKKADCDIVVFTQSHKHLREER